MDELTLELKIRQAATETANSYFEMYCEYLRRFDKTIQGFIREEKYITAIAIENYYNDVPSEYRNEFPVSQYITDFRLTVGLMFCEMIEEQIEDIKGEHDYLEKALTGYDMHDAEDVELMEKDKKEIGRLESEMKRFRSVIDQYKKYLAKKNKKKPN